METAPAVVRSATIDTIEPRTLYQMLQLRVEVFTHEQQIYSEPEIDGLDLLPTTTLMWIEEEGTVAATLRVLQHEAVAHIGRVATAKAARGRGLMGALMRAAIERFPGPIEISAQAYLEQWYGSFGFRTTGEGYIEAGIAHLPMRRE